MASTLTIDGRAYRIVERMGYQPGIGGHACMVMDDETGIGHVAVRPHAGAWRLWTEEDRSQPLGTPLRAKKSEATGA
jgi:hypothetical protein